MESEIEGSKRYFVQWAAEEKITNTGILPSIRGSCEFVKIDEAILANYLLYTNEETREDDLTLIFERLRSNGVHLMEGSAIHLASESGVYD
jgi:hypothetical protein